MRIYYCAEAEGQRHHVRSALGVDARAWNETFRRVRDWRGELERRHHIPTNRELRACDFVGAMQPAPSCNCGDHSTLTARRGAEVILDGLRLIEDIAVDTGGVQVVNVCLDNADVPAYRRVGLDRLFNRVNATAAHDRAYAFVVMAGGEDDMAARLYRRLRNYNPVPSGQRTGDGGGDTRNVPIERIIGGPAFRSPESDCLLQMAGLIAHALLWQEEPPIAGAAGCDFGRAFGILDRALNLRAARRDPQGVVRR